MEQHLNPRKMPQQERAQALVEAILDATTRVLVKHGYAGANTNRIAEVAGISVGSLYQYFPNKNSLISALHRRHAKEIRQTIETTVKNSRGQSLAKKIETLIGASLAAHMIAPELHRVLETQFASLDQYEGEAEDQKEIFENLRNMLEAHRSELKVKNLELATHVVIRIVDTLIHAAVIDPQPMASVREMEREINRAALGYLMKSPKT
jgi:AcrR family transcriptional regulator